MNNLKKALQEIKDKRIYLVLISMFLLFSYAVFFFAEEEMIIKLTEEAGFFESLTAIGFLGASIVFFMSFLKKRKQYVFLILAVILFFGFGEEISWGQRIFGWGTPETLKEVNVQGETNIHNLAIFNGIDFENNRKTGFAKYFSMNVMYKLFCLGFGVILPFLVMFGKMFDGIINKFKIPVPSLAIGLGFILNWVVFYLLVPLFPEIIRHPLVEVQECCSAFVFFMLSLPFLKLAGNISMEE
ncbi:MAG: hypothetical protein K9J37_13030 [Saprospiraceae bacterium]|nr:hypothetical protein [Saprospiraceae bacterium]MCF8250831.1 hypothetical protein [Saprospiraceae bacterium]MCF8281648.1 hypothetical protein [Bacteroidales bacterium]MCF8312632.1 hypothetical protein [Saprospiraceae bacterium]MCF8441022.1 hypothetical protein [Saprospiraceae bacterium]